MTEIEYTVTPNMTYNPAFNGSLTDYFASSYSNVDSTSSLTDMLNVNSGTVINNGTVLGHYNNGQYLVNNNLNWYQTKNIYESMWNNENIKTNMLNNNHSEFKFKEVADSFNKNYLTSLTGVLGAGLGIFGLGIGLDLYNNFFKKENNQKLDSVSKVAKFAGIATMGYGTISTYNAFNELYMGSSSIDKLIGASGMTKTIGYGGIAIGASLFGDGILNLYKNYNGSKSKLGYAAASAEIIGGGISLYSGASALVSPLASSYLVSSTALSTATIAGQTVNSSLSIALNPAVSTALGKGIGVISSLGTIGLIGGIIGLVGFGVSSFIKSKKKKSNIKAVGGSSFQE